MKRLLSLLLAVMMVVGSAAMVFAAEEPLMTILSNPVDTILIAPAPSNDIVILTTNDAHCGNYANYAKVATLAKDADFLVDAGDHLQGGVLGSISKGEYIIDIMNKVGYDVATFGNHEFDYSYTRLQELAGLANHTYVSCNFVDLDTKASLFDAYTIKEAKGKKIAFIGITTPETFAKSTPTFFQDADGNYIYGFSEGGDGQELYKKVQETVNAAKAAGADYIVALGHLGIDEESSPWTVNEVLANVTGIDAFADGHSHSTYTKTVGATQVVQTGTKLENVGKIVIKEDGTITVENVALADVEDDEEVKAYIASIDEAYKAEVTKVVAKTSVNLTTKNADGTRAVRSKETNLGDLCADAYRTLLGADIAFVNGGGVRADLAAGDITKEQIMTVHPFGNLACLVEVTGQQILDALELGASKLPSENGGFLQVSGLTYTVNTSIESHVVLNDKSEFVKVDGERRVCNVKVAGVPIDPNKTYKLASHNYMLYDGGDGYKMFGKENVTVLKDEVMLDNQVLMTYIIENLNGVVGSQYAEPQGRITITDHVEETYTVAKGDCLWNIAKKVYGNGSYWKVIYEANKSSIKNPNVIYVNQTFVLPQVM